MCSIVFEGSPPAYSIIMSVFKIYIYIFNIFVISVSGRNNRFDCLMLQYDTSIVLNSFSFYWMKMVLLLRIRLLEVEGSWVHNTVLFRNEKHRLTWYNSMQYPKSHVDLYYEWNSFKFLKDKKLHLLKLSSNFSSYWLNIVGKKICFILPKHHFTTSLPHQWTFPGNPGCKCKLERECFVFLQEEVNFLALNFLKTGCLPCIFVHSDSTDLQQALYDMKLVFTCMQVHSFNYYKKSMSYPVG